MKGCRWQTGCYTIPISISLNTVSSPRQTIKATVSGDINYTYYLNYSIAKSDIVSASWGSWSNKVVPLTINAKNAGSTQITIKMCKSSDNSVVVTTYLNVKVAEPEKQKYTVTYNANGGTGAPSSQTKTEGVSLTLSSVVPTKSYTITYDSNGGSNISPKTIQASFKNWNTNKTGTGKSYNKGSAYTDNANVTLYAQYNNATITNNYLPILSRDGYRFSGWYTSKSGGSRIRAGMQKMISR